MPENLSEAIWIARKEGDESNREIVRYDHIECIGFDPRVAIPDVKRYIHARKAPALRFPILSDNSYPHYVEEVGLVSEEAERVFGERHRLKTRIFYDEAVLLDEWVD